MEPILYGRYCAGCFANIACFNPHNTPSPNATTWPIYRLREVTWLESDRARSAGVLNPGSPRPKFRFSFVKPRQGRKGKQQHSPKVADWEGSLLDIQSPGPREH